jgi:hypothetical protein
MQKDNTDIIQNTFGTLLNNELKQIRDWGVVLVLDGEVEWGGGGGGGEDANRQTVELFMAGDILFYTIALGKEGFATWWCNWCRLFKTNWQSTDHQIGIPWNMDLLKAHASTIENGTVSLSSVQDVGGVKEQALFVVINIDHFVPPTLHLTIGKGNDVLENLTTRELQAAAEAYSASYYKTKTNATLAILSLERAKEELQ